MVVEAALLDAEGWFDIEEWPGIDRFSRLRRFGNSASDRREPVGDILGFR